MTELLQQLSPSELLFYLTSVYGAHFVLLALSAITIYRREMSCNHCYAEDKTYNNNDQQQQNGHEVPAPVATGITVNWQEETAEDILDEVGLLGKSPLWPLLYQLVEKWDKRTFREAYENAKMTVLQHKHQTQSSFRRTAQFKTTRATRTSSSATEVANLFSMLPADVHADILSCLHPRDVVQFACVSKLCQRAAESSDLWRKLWERDYSWILNEWKIGKHAMKRSRVLLAGSPLLFDKEFYFTFALAWINYVLAGKNSYDECLVGIGGHVYDLTAFISSHPGSPETVMVQSGKDATAFFSAVRHSLGARRLAQSLCVVVDLSISDGQSSCGLCPTKQTFLKPNADATCVPRLVDAAPIRGEHQTRSRRPGMLKTIRDVYLDQEAVAKRASRQFDKLSLMEEVNVFYDPMVGQWRAWYLDRNLQLVFVNEL
jgi:hypothetical protein